MVDAVVCEACKQVRHQESHIVTFYCTCVSVGHHKGLIKETTREFNTERIPSYSSYQPPTDSVLICLNFPWIPNITSFTSWKRGGRCESKNLLLWKTTEEDGRSDSTVGAPWSKKRNREQLKYHYTNLFSLHVYEDSHHILQNENCVHVSIKATDQYYACISLSRHHQETGQQPP